MDIDLIGKEINKKHIDGVMSTPFYLADFMVSKCTIDINDKIIDPCVGHGVFPIAILKRIEYGYKLSALDLYNYFINNIDCYDINTDSLNAFKEYLTEFFLEKGLNKATLLFPNIHNEDFLFNDSNKKYNLCIGNPPYIRTKNIESDYLKKLRSEYVTCKSGNIDIYYAFFEKGMKISDTVMFITPNSYMNNMSSAKLSDLMQEKGVEYLLDFKSKKIFEGVGTYCAITKLCSNESNVTRYENDLHKGIEEIKTEDIFIKRVNNHNIKIYSGIATLADKLYTVYKRDGNFYTKYNNVKVDKDIVVPLLKLTKFDKNNIEYIIYPYSDNDIIEETVLKNNYSNTYNYLLSVKDLLEKRDKGKTEKYDAWYAYGRKQGFNSLNEGTVMVIPKMISKNNKPFEIKLESVLDEYDNFLFTSGYIITGYTENEKNLIYSDHFLKECKKYGKSFPGKSFDYYSISKTILDTIFSNFNK